MIKKKTGLSLMFTLVLVMVLSTVVVHAKDVTLQYYYVGSRQADEEDVYEHFNELLKEKGYDIQVEFKRLGWGQYGQKMNLVVASGEQFDLCFAANWIEHFRFQQNVAKGAFLPINDLLTDDLKDSLPDSLWGAASINGEIFGVPNYQQYYSQHAFYIQKKVADKVNIDPDLINEYQDIEKYLPAIKENFPDLYPIANSFHFITNIYESIANSRTSIVVDEPGYRVYGNAPGSVANHLMFREWLRNGWIREDVAIIDNQRGDIEALRYSVWDGAYTPGTAERLTDQYGAEIIAIPYDEPYIQMNAGSETMTAIGRQSDNPEEAMKLIQLLNTDKDLYNTLCYGIEGVHYNKVGDNMIKQVEGSKYNPGLSWMFGNTFNAYYTSENQKEAKARTFEIQKTAKVSKLRGFKPDLSEIKSLIARVTSLAQEFEGREWVLLDDDDAYVEEYKAHQKRLNQAGRAKIEEEIQRQVNVWVAENRPDGEEWVEKWAAEQEE